MPTRDTEVYHANAHSATHRERFFSYGSRINGHTILWATSHKDFTSKPRANLKVR